jgi:hypothetical protein
LKNRSRLAHDQRKIIDGKSYLLYRWPMSDTHDRLHSSKQRLNSSNGTGNGSFSVPPVVEKKHGSSECDDDSMANLSKGSSKKLNRNNDDIKKLSFSIAKH